MCIKRPAGLSAGPGARGEDEESVRERERAALSAGEMEFYLDESSDRSARMGKEWDPVSPPAELMTKSSLIESMEDVREAFFHCARHQEVKKRNLCYIWK